MSAQPLSHHEILGLVAPFARRGRQVDLGASQRLERRLAFKPVDRQLDDGTAVAETLQLDHPQPGHFVLIRSLRLVDGIAPGLTARLQTEGPDAEPLLNRIDAVAPQQQFDTGPGHALAFDHLVTTDPPVPRLKQAELRTGGLTLRLKMPGVHGFPAEFTLEAPNGQGVALPDDLLAVLGRPWSALTPERAGWRGTLSPRGAEPTRSRGTETRLAEAARHLARTFSEPPARYHDRLRRSRFRVLARRCLPLLSLAGLVGAAAAVPYLGLAEDSAWRMLIFNSPPLLVAFGLCLKEMPRFEIPPWPRRAAGGQWGLAEKESAAPVDLSVTPSTEPR